MSRGVSAVRQHPVEIVDRLLGGDDLDRLHPHRRRRLEVDAEVVEEQALAWLDTEQLAFTLQGLMLGYHHAARLMRDPKALQHTRRALDQLLEASAA